MKQKREELASILKERRNSKSVKKVVFQEQMINFIKEDAQMKKEDLEMKRRMINHYESSEQQFGKVIQNLGETISRTMSEGFAMMQQMLQPGMPNQYYGQGQRSNYGHFSNQYGAIYIQQLAQSQETEECSKFIYRSFKSTLTIAKNNMN